MTRNGSANVSRSAGRWRRSAVKVAPMSAMVNDWRAWLDTRCPRESWSRCATTAAPAIRQATLRLLQFWRKSLVGFGA